MLKKLRFITIKPEFDPICVA